MTNLESNTSNQTYSLIKHVKKRKRFDARNVFVNGVPDGRFTQLQHRKFVFHSKEPNVLALFSGKLLYLELEILVLRTVHFHIS